MPFPKVLVPLLVVAVTGFSAVAVGKTLGIVAAEAAAAAMLVNATIAMKARPSSLICFMRFLTIVVDCPAGTAVRRL